MKKRFACNKGHQWEVSVAGGNVATLRAISCPVCGAAAETVATDQSVRAQPETVAYRPEGETATQATQFSLRAPSSTEQSPTAKPKPAAVVPDRYEIQEELGKGGMGRVYKAFDKELRRVIAMKVPHFNPNDREGLKRFKHEAQAAATFNHPNLCPVFDVGERDGVPYLTMPYVPGQSLAAVIDATRNAGRQFPIRQVVLVIRKLALALEHAHRKGVIHRDLKPGNVMISKQDGSQEPLIMDFGLARSESTDTRLTSTGMIMGTPGYMAPEQASGLTKETGAAGDVYSLGIIFYELLTLRLPFEPPALLYKIVHEPPDPPSKHRAGLDPALEVICLKCLEKKPENRFTTMKELAGALSDWLKAPTQARAPAADTLGSGVGVFAELAHEPPRERTRNGIHFPWWAIVAAASAAMVLVAGIVIYVATNNGTVKIELSEPNAQVQVKVDGDVVTLTSNDGTLTLKPGVHDMEVSSDKFRTVTKSFVVKRGENEPIRVTLEPKAAIPKPPVLAAKDDAKQERARPAPPSGQPAADSTAPTTEQPSVGAKDDRPAATQPQAPAVGDAALGFESLLNGKDLTGWIGTSGKPATWKVADGYVEVIPGQGNIWTEAKYTDFELHAEFWIPPVADQGPQKGNSGIYLQGRYEIQIYDSYSYQLKPEQACGALYAIAGPSRDANRPPDQWQSFDVTFRAPVVDGQGNVNRKGRLSLVHNGVKVIDDADFDRVTGLALDRTQGTPGPIMLQDHGSRVRFRNLRIKPLTSTPPAAAKPNQPASSIPADAVTFNGHSYKFFPEKLTWKEAVAKCKALGGHLVVIETAAENRFVAGLVEKAGWVDTWIGITDEAKEGDWRTIDQTPLAYVNWHPGQPNNKGSGEHFALLSNRMFGKPVGWMWCDQPNQSVQHEPGYVCEWDSVAQAVRGPAPNLAPPEQPSYGATAEAATVEPGPALSSPTLAAMLARASRTEAIASR